MVDKLKKYFKPATNPVVERHIFSQMKYEAKSVEVVASLRSQARKGNYTAEEMDDRIRDKLVSTCPSSKVKVQLLKEEDLTLAKAIKVWSTDSHIQNQAEKLGERKMKVEDATDSVNKIGQIKKPFDKKKHIPRDSKVECFRCGLSIVQSSSK